MRGCSVDDRRAQLSVIVFPSTAIRPSNGLARLTDFLYGFLLSSFVGPLYGYSLDIVLMFSGPTLWLPFRRRSPSNYPLDSIRATGLGCEGSYVYPFGYSFFLDSPFTHGDFLFYYYPRHLGRIHTSYNVGFPLFHWSVGLSEWRGVKTFRAY